MFKITDLKELIRAVDKSTITELTIKGEGKQEVTIKRGTTTEFVAPAETAAPVAAPAPTPAPAAAPAPAAPVQEEKQPEAAVPVVEDANLHKITSPMVGTFYSAPSPDSDPYVKAGDKVTQESVVCIVEAMKLMNELEAEVNGEIVEVLVENGQLVEYGQPLFLVKLA
ncbi:acetyl-CoA carboxylase biotin carboxyl carrier protein [Alkalihalobacterium sp. APHAB7]|uniref:acetyl-CoA carboxylase biotin carboxyl carrier protein n=1 Tax=Alkalihalobacterium sp. APHAB7 TaxID=3402081 RepID=UPI003AAC024D